MKDNILLKSGAKAVGIWIRVSTQDQAEGDSPAHHEQRARSYAESKGWQVKEVYNLAGQSGKAVMQHPEAKRMMKDIERRHVTGLVFSKLARLSRSRRELEDFVDYFNKFGADLISISEAIDTSTAGGRMFFHLLGVFAQWEREEIADRIKASLPVRAKLGKPLGGGSPFGYRWKDKKLVQDPQEAPIRKLAFELFLKYRRKLAVAKELNAAGYRTRAGKNWSDIAISRTLRCPSAKGTYYLNRTRQTGNWSWEPKPESEWGLLKLEPIVSETLWGQCNHILEDQAKNKKPLGKKTVHLFAGLAFCACGQKMYVKQNSPKYVCQKCLNKIPIIDLEAIVLEDLKAFFAAPEQIARHLEEANQNLKAKESLLQSHQNEIQKVRAEMTRTHRLYVDGDITGHGFGQFYKPAEQRLNQLIEELPKLEAEVDCLKVNALSTEELVVEVRDFHVRWPTLPIDQKRRIVEAIIEKITIGKGEIEITLSHSPTSEELVKNQQALLSR